MFKCRFACQVHGSVHLVSETGAKLEGFVAVPRTLAGVGNLKRISKNAFRVAGAVLETHEPDM